MLTQDQVNTLRAVGFIHVTGLPYRNMPGNGGGTVKSEIRWLGKHDSNNSRIALHTMEGEVWWRDGYFNEAEVGEQMMKEFIAVRDQICPKGSGAFVVCSNGEMFCDAVTMSDDVIRVAELLTTRISNPYDTFGNRIPINGESAWEPVKPRKVA